MIRIEESPPPRRSHTPPHRSSANFQLDWEISGDFWIVNLFNGNLRVIHHHCPLNDPLFQAFFSGGGWHWGGGPLRIHMIINHRSKSLVSKKGLQVAPASERVAPAHRNPVPEISPEEIVKYTWLQASRICFTSNIKQWIFKKSCKKNRSWRQMHCRKLLK